MQELSSDNKRIAKNTMYLYVRMLVMAAVGLFTSRIVLDALGAEDYGIYNVVGGVIVLFSFLNSALISSTQRFINFFLGKKDMNMVNAVFSLSMSTYIVLSLVIILLGETIGLWFLNTYLNIPEDRMWAARIAYHFTIIQFVVNMLCVPYNATILAYERMDFYAYMSLVDVVAKLLVVYLLYISPFDRLLVYSLLYTIIPVVIIFIYKIYCNRHFSSTKYRRLWDAKLFKEMFSFSGWFTLNGFSNVLSIQGLNIILNMFHGVTLNAASAVASQVSSKIYAFVNNFQVAFQPQIYKNYAAGETEKYNTLIFRASKFSCFLFLILMIPITFTLDKILSIWLVEVPKYTSEFCRLILINQAIDSINLPLFVAVDATGKIKNHRIVLSLLKMMNLPIAYFVLFVGMAPYSIWFVRIGVTFLTGLYTYFYIKYTQNFPIVSFLKKVIIPITLVVVLSTPIPSILNHCITAFWWNLGSVGISSLVITIIAVIFVGMNGKERKIILSAVGRRIPFLKH